MSFNCSTHFPRLDLFVFTSNCISKDIAPFMPEFLVFEYMRICCALLKTNQLNFQMSLPGGPFLFGALLAFMALLITMSLPEAAPMSKVDIKKKTDIDNDSLESGYINQDLSPLLSDSLA